MIQIWTLHRLNIAPDSSGSGAQLRQKVSIFSHFKPDFNYQLENRITGLLLSLFFHCESLNSFTSVYLNSTFVPGGSKTVSTSPQLDAFLISHCGNVSGQFCHLQPAAPRLVPQRRLDPTPHSVGARGGAGEEEEASFQISQLIEGVNKRGEKSPSVAYTSQRQNCNTNTHSAVTTQRPPPGNYARPFSSSRPCSRILHEAEVSM